MKKRKQFISLAITAAMLVSAFPLSALADKNDDSVFVTMNIPYNTFYQADIKNDVAVDAVTSATTSKWTTFSGTYHTEAAANGGGQILGVSFPVEVSKEDYAKLKNAESENDDYYFTELKETPSVYKTLSVDGDGKYSFSEVKGNVNDASDFQYTLSTDSKYGDYQIELSNTTIDGTVYGIIVTTDDGTQYGLRHLENIWKKSFQFAWSSGVKTTESHGNTLAPNHYKSIMGETIKEITYITDKGITNYNVDSYVPVKVTSVVSVENAKVSDNSTAVTITPALPDDFNAAYIVSGLDAAYTGGKLVYKNAAPGSYSLTVTDQNKNYADISTSFVLSTDKAAAKYDDENKSLAADEYVTADEFKNYLAAISTVTVDGTNYAASGKRAVHIIGKDGKLDLAVKNGDSRVFAADKTEFTVKVSATGYPDLEFTVTKESEITFVAMNIPYSVFYASDVKNDVDVDAVTSSTTNIWKTFGGTYITDANENGGGNILGVTFPVAVANEDIDKLKAVEGTASDYYFTELESIPSVYKTLTIDSKGNYSFSAVKGEVTNVDDAQYTLSTETPWGDYLFEFSDVTIDGNVYGIVVTTDDGSQYGMRHLENIWKKTFEFAWGSGIKNTEPHGNTLAPEHYKSLMGKTIKTVTYITDKGITNYNVDAYVPVKVANAVSVADANVTDSSTAVTITPELPEDFNAEYTVSGLEAAYTDGKLSYSNAKPGSYILTVSDKNGKYADISSTFVLSTSKVVAKYGDKALVANNATEDEFKTYLANIATVTVDGTDYAASGRRFIAIIGSDGAIDLTAKNGSNAVFAEDKDEYNVKVSATGYPDLEFTISTKETSDEPTKPTDPTEPAKPADPTDPTEPAKPTDPTDPTEPAKPTDPTDPTEPAKPADPTDPTEPAKPTDPTDPTEPAKPTDPTDPTDPTEPAKPADPTEPTEPAKPAEPKTVKFGDVNGDGKIDSGDSLIILRASVKLEKLTDEQIKLADIDNDGRITANDSLAVLRASVKLFDETNKNVGKEIELDVE